MPDYDMKNMKLSAQAQKEETVPSVVEAPQYPYGLRLELGNEALDKLDMAELPEVGKKLAINARVEVVAVSKNEMKGGEARRSVSLQITDLGLGGDVQARREPGDALYGTPEAENLKPVETIA